MIRDHIPQNLRTHTHAHTRNKVKLSCAPPPQSAPDSTYAFTYFGGIASRGARYLRFLARRASDRKRGRDGIAYSDYHASRRLPLDHLARISVAAVYWDAQHIDEGVRFLKQRAQPLA